MLMQDPNRYSKLALEGLDVVMYLGHFQSVSGKAQLKTKYKGKTYCFCNRENLQLFTNNPEMFIPRFEGHCAYTYALHGKLVRALPAYSNVVGDKLYLYSKPHYAAICRFLPVILQWAEARHDAIVAEVDEVEGKPETPAPAPRGIKRWLKSGLFSASEPLKIRHQS